METLQTIILALLQGLTEFLPISSSAHLILVPVITGWQDQGLAFDVAVHVGTLFAVLIYFRKQVASLFIAWLRSLPGILPGSDHGKHDNDSKLAWAVIVGTIPVGIVGLLGKDFIEGYLREPLVIALATIVFAILLWYADAKRKEISDEYSMSWRDVIFIGVAQAFALIPGTSRSGVTMTAGLMAGMTRTGAARFSFLLSLPVIVLAGGLETLELLHSSDPVAWGQLIFGTLLSFVAALACIHYFLMWLPRIGMFPFVIYRLLLGVVLLAVFI